MRNPYQSTRGMKVFSLFIFVLAAAPRLSMKIGTLPIYAIDILILVMLLTLPRRNWSVRNRGPFVSLITTIWVFAMLSELAGVVYGARATDALYLMARTCLAFSVFFVARGLVRTPKDVEQLLKSAVLGMILTSTLMILTSLPSTRNATLDIFFSSKFLEPAAETVGSAFLEAIDTGARGRSLVGVSIVGATFINVFWPFAALLSIWPFAVGYWRKIALVACLLAPVAVLMSYSRGPILGTILIIIFAVVFSAARLRNKFVTPILATVLIVAAVGVNSDLFFFDRLTNRTQAIFENPFADERESERILAYVEPFQHVIENPGFLFIGEGNVASRGGFRPEQESKATHALFAKAYYSYGLIAAVLYMILLYYSFSTALNYSKAMQNSTSRLYGQVLLASVVALLPWAMFGHAIVSAPRGSMLFFLIIGLLTTIGNFQRPISSKSIRKVIDVDRRNFTV